MPGFFFSVWAKTQWKLGNRPSLVGALGWQAREGPSIIPRLCTFTIWKQGGWQEFYHAGAPFGNNDVIQCYIAQNMGGGHPYSPKGTKKDSRFFVLILLFSENFRNFRFFASHNLSQKIVIFKYYCYYYIQSTITSQLIDPQNLFTPQIKAVVNLFSKLTLFLRFTDSKYTIKPFYCFVYKINLPPWWPKRKNKVTFNIQLPPI